MRRNKHANYQSRVMNASIPIHSLYGQAGLGEVATNSSFPISWSAERVWELMTLGDSIVLFVSDV